MLCMHCGQPMPPEAQTCKNCGTPVPKVQTVDALPAPTPQDRGTTGAFMPEGMLVAMDGGYGIETGSHIRGSGEEEPQGPAHDPKDFMFQGSQAPHATPLAPPAGTTPLTPEQEVWSGGAHWKSVLAPKWLLPYALAIALWFVPQSDGFQWKHILWWLEPLLILGPAAWLALQAWYRCSVVHYRLTNERMTVTKGIFSRTGQDMNLVRVEDIRYEQSFVNRLLGVGDVIIISSDKDQPDLVLRGVERPNRLKEILWGIVRERRRALLYLEQTNK